MVISDNMYVLSGLHLHTDPTLFTKKMQTNQPNKKPNPMWLSKTNQKSPQNPSHCPKWAVQSSPAPII